MIWQGHCARRETGFPALTGALSASVCANCIILEPGQPPSWCSCIISFNNPTNYPIFQRFALQTNEPLNIPTNLPIKPTNPRNNPTNPVLASSAEKPHKHKKGRSREHPRSALNREKAQKYWSFWQKEKYPDSIKIRVLLWRRRRDLNPRGVFRHPTPLAGEPLRPLGYFCKPLRYTNTAGATCQGENGKAFFEAFFAESLLPGRAGCARAAVRLRASPPHRCGYRRPRRGRRARRRGSRDAPGRPGG